MTAATLVTPTRASGRSSPSSPCGRAGLPFGTLLLGSALIPLLRHPDGNDGRRVAGADSLRRGGDRGRLVARRAAFRRAPRGGGLIRAPSLLRPHVCGLPLLAAGHSSSSPWSRRRPITWGRVRFLRDNHLGELQRQISFLDPGRKFDVALRLFEHGGRSGDRDAGARPRRLPRPAWRGDARRPRRGGWGLGARRCLIGPSSPRSSGPPALDPNRRLAGTKGKRRRPRRGGPDRTFSRGDWGITNLVDFCRSASTTEGPRWRCVPGVSRRREGPRFRAGKRGAAVRVPEARGVEWRRAVERHPNPEEDAPRRSSGWRGPSSG